jgi:phosphate/sulfate permease
MLRSSPEERYDYSVFIALNLEEDQKVALDVFSYFCTDLDKDVPYEEIAKIIFNRESITPDSDIEIVCNNIDYLKDVLIPKISRLSNLETIIIRKNIGLMQQLGGDISLEDFIIKRLEKTKRHFSLAIRQREYMELNIGRVHANIEQAKKEITEIDKRIVAQTSEMNEIKNIRKTIYTEFITILGIFSALMFGMITGFNSLTEALGEIANADLYIGKVIMGISAIMMGLVSFVYVLLKCIGILIGKPLEDEVDDLPEGVNEFQKFFLKNKFFFGINFILVILFLFGVLLFVSSVSGITFSLTRNKVGALYLIAFIVLLITIVMPDTYNKWSKPDKETHE